MSTLLSKKLTRPKCLNTGDYVGIVSPAGPVDDVSLKKGLNALKHMGFKPVLGNYVREKVGFLSGTDEQRAADLMDMFKNPTIKAIFCTRGGYGVNRVLPLLKAKVIRENPKIVVGSSDITLLLLFLKQKCSMVAFHGPMPAGSFGRSPMKHSRKLFCDLLLKKQISALISRSAKIIRPGMARGALTGGCLTLLCRSLRTPFEIDTRDQILLIEDVNEPPYRIDGMLWQLRQAGKFKSVRGVLIGEMIKCHPPKEEGYSLSSLINDFFADENIPVLMTCPIGHGKEIWTLPLGIEAELDANAKELILKENGVC